MEDLFSANGTNKNGRFHFRISTVVFPSSFFQKILHKYEVDLMSKLCVLNRINVRLCDLFWQFIVDVYLNQFREFTFEFLSFLNYIALT